MQKFQGSFFGSFFKRVMIIVWMAVEDKIVLSMRNKKLYERIIADSLVS